MAVQINDSLYKSNGYVDQIMGPYNSFTDIARLRTTLFDGLTVIVTNNNHPVTLQFVGNVKQKFHWTIKTLSPFETYNDLIATTNDILSVFNKNGNSNMFYVGLEATIQTNNENDDVEKFMVTNVTDGVPTWSLVIDPSRRIVGDDVE